MGCILNHPASGTDAEPSRPVPNSRLLQLNKSQIRNPKPTYSFNLAGLGSGVLGSGARTSG